MTEYNRLVKANYLLCYIDDASLRNYVQRALNRERPITNCVGP
nr:Tn3 family transposase [Escherichia coli]